jgi:1-deoxy-D-xylulose-5-phosphate reductoisomerase
LFGEAALCQVAADSQVDIVMAAIVGAAGLAPTIAAASAGKRLLLANKESLVVAGQLLLDAVVKGGATLLPIDSEHNAIFQCLNGVSRESYEREVRRLVLTASGGPFRQFSEAALADVTPEQACKHPNWSMGQKISVDSATLMNKGLEVIEAFWLFGLPIDQIDVLVHPQSVIHSMVEFIDGSVMAQLGQPDMRTPIAYGLSWPARIDSGVTPLDFLKIAQLSFELPDLKRFPALQLAYDAIRLGGTAPTILNAANEVAVTAFLQGRITFNAIPIVIHQTLGKISVEKVESLAQLFSVDQESRVFATEYVRTSWS